MHLYIIRDRNHSLRKTKRTKTFQILKIIYKPPNRNTLPKYNTSFLIPSGRQQKNGLLHNYHRDGKFRERSKKEQISDEQSAFSFLAEVKDPRATQNCWAYKVGEEYRCNDDGEPPSTAGKPILSAIESSGIDGVMVVVIRHFGGIKLGMGGLVRAYGGVASDCLRNAPTRLIKSKIPMRMEVPLNLIRALHHQLQPFQLENIEEDYETGKDGIVMVSFKVDHDKAEQLEVAIKSNCSRDLVFYKQ